MLKKKKALITGASGGIGMATVKAFARQGAIIFACCRQETSDYVQKLKETAQAEGTNIYPFYFDITDEKEVKATVRNISKEFGGIDILINNAGISIEKVFSMTTYTDMQTMLNTNFLSQIRLAQLVSRSMIKQKSGSIVNVASVAGIECEPGGIAYGSSKTALIFATKTMALELGKFGIRVNCVSPGFIATNMWKKRKDEIREKIMRETPLGRQGQPEEVANAILFLASGLSSFITGENIIVDGGRLSGGGGRKA
ncbi:MAG: SDR family oxidoreductase [Selenomonadaceae bacterium]|nr:SDR family oxidoreductase [Selenomonadaceae bacterium]